jgi:hypothetical protein
MISTISFKKFCGYTAALLLFVGCTKERGPLTDIKPAVPVTVSNAIDFRPEATVSTSLATGNIQITLAIPASTGRTIKEITKIAASTSYTQIQSTGATGFYTPVATPITVNATSYTFNTTLTAYLGLYPTPAPIVNSELSRRFYFLVTLDDGTQIVTNPVRVLVL